MSTAVEHDPYYDDDDRFYEHVCDETCGPVCWYDDQPDLLPRGVHPANVALLDGSAVDAMDGLRQIRHVPPAEVPAEVMVQAVLASQRLASYAKAQAAYWTAAFAGPGVAVPVATLLESIAHRNDEQGWACDIPEELAERAAAGHTVFGDPLWDGLVAAEAARFAEPELSAAWLVAPITAHRRIAEAHELIDELPDTFTALEQGRIEEVRARVIADATHHIDPNLRARAEQLILDRAKRGMTPGDLGRLAKKVVADVDPEAAGKRAEQARARRGTHVRDLGDDMARFTADLAVEDAALTEAILDLLAEAIPQQCRQGRGASQLRADIFADLFGQLADTGLIDLRGINPTDPDVEPDSTEPADNGVPGPDGAAQETAQPDPAEPDLTDPDAAVTDAADTDSAEADEPDADDPGWQDADVEPAAPPADLHGSDAESPGPTVSELLAQLNGSDWESRLDPDCVRRGGLLSMIRLPAGLRVNLDVTVALSTLAGCDELSARLAGLGVITADTARALAKAAGTVRILLINDPPGPPNGSPQGGAPPANNGGIHHGSPDCGTVVDFGRTVYRPPASVIDRVNTRDKRCRFPGCPMIAVRCDKDHRTTWDQGGATCPCDLDALCRFHHRIKTFTAWTAVRDQSANTMTWTSPLGRVHVDRPAPDLPTGTALHLSDRSEAGAPAEVADLSGVGQHDDDPIADRDPDDPPF
jgi:hypothetical protein